MSRVLFGAGATCWLLAVVIFYLLLAGIMPGGAALGSYRVQIGFETSQALTAYSVLSGFGQTLFLTGAVFIVGGVIVRTISRR